MEQTTTPLPPWGEMNKRQRGQELHLIVVPSQKGNIKSSEKALLIAFLILTSYLFGFTSQAPMGRGPAIFQDISVLIFRPSFQ